MCALIIHLRVSYLQGEADVLEGMEHGLDL